jgi:hypothetical protein
VNDKPEQNWAPSYVADDSSDARQQWHMSPDPNDPNPRLRSGVCRCWPTQLQAARLRAQARRRFETRWDDREGWWTAA